MEYNLDTLEDMLSIIHNIIVSDIYDIIEDGEVLRMSGKFSTKNDVEIHNTTFMVFKDDYFNCLRNNKLKNIIKNI